MDNTLPAYPSSIFCNVSHPATCGFRPIHTHSYPVKSGWPWKQAHVTSFSPTVSQAFRPWSLVSTVGASQSVLPAFTVPQYGRGNHGLYHDPAGLTNSPRWLKAKCTTADLTAVRWYWRRVSMSKRCIAFLFVRHRRGLGVLRFFRVDFPA
jgi:hypothetical protein